MAAKREVQMTIIFRIFDVFPSNSFCSYIPYSADFLLASCLYIYSVVLLRLTMTIPSVFYISSVTENVGLSSMNTAFVFSTTHVNIS